MRKHSDSADEIQFIRSLKIKELRELLRLQKRFLSLYAAEESRLSNLPADTRLIGVAPGRLLAAWAELERFRDSLKQRAKA